MHDDILNLLRARKGHFRLESGHHGNLWLDLELLCLHPQKIQPLAAELAKRLAAHRIEIVCGPLVEGAFIALMIASEMNVEFTYTERFAPPQIGGLFPVQYRLPGPLRAKVHGKRVAIVNDVINAGSAVRGTHADLIACDAQPVAIASLLTLGPSASTFVTDQNIALETLAAHSNVLWLPDECPLCASRVPFDNEPASPS